MRINVQLISTETGAHLWADRFDEPMKDLAEGQEQIVKRLGNALGWELTRVEATRSARDRSASPDAFDLFLRARSVLNLPFSREHLAEGTALLERAVQLDPTLAVAKANLAASLLNAGNDPDTLKRAAALLADAAATAPNSVYVLGVSVYVLRAQRHWSEALAVAQRMMELHPHFADSYNQLATMKFATGALDEAIPLQEQSIRLDPRSPWLFERYQRIGYALLVLGREQESVVWFQRSLASDPDLPPPARAIDYRGLAAAYASTGHSDEANQAMAEAGRLDHFETARSDIQWFGSATAIMQTRRYQEKLRAAGFRDHADEDADFGAAPDSQLHRVIQGYTPTKAPGATTIRTADLASFIRRSGPIVIDTLWDYLDRSIPGAVGLLRSGVGGNFSDMAQTRLRTKMAELTKGDMAVPLVAVGWSSERFDSYNLALRLVALGYTNVYWYRGGRETWEANGLPETPVEMRDW